MKETKVVTPPENLDDDSAQAAHPHAKTKREHNNQHPLCIKNIIMQWFGMDDDVQCNGWGDLCREDCFFAHIPVGNINRSSLETAILAGEKLWGSEFIDNEWPACLRHAFANDDNVRRKPDLLPSGKPYPY